MPGRSGAAGGVTWQLSAPHVTALLTFRLFVSSTFSDLQAERNALQEHVFPRLRKLCAQHGARFQAIDLRWGVSDEAALDQQTMSICLDEIARCQRLAPRPNFVVLLGDRYGWCPPPPQVPAAVFEQILDTVPPDDRRLLHKWYCRDDNAVPPAYDLQPRQRGSAYQDPATWAPVEARLRAALARAAARLDLPRHRRLTYEASATHQEIAAGALQVEDAPEHVLCFFREIDGLPEDARGAPFLDLDADGRPDAQAQAQLGQLKAGLKQRLGGNVVGYRARWTGETITRDHIDALCRDAYVCLSGLILAQLEAAVQVDPLHREIADHERFGRERAHSFVGRADVLQTIAGYLAEDARHPLAIWGPSGSGKSALLARAADRALESHQSSEVIVRYIGATPDSSDGRALLEDVCRQIALSHGAGEADIPTDFRDLVPRFRDHLAMATASHPLLLFLDGLDQLSDANNARGLAWLPADLPDHVHVVVSTTAAPCQAALAAKLPPAPMAEMAPMPVEEAETFMIVDVPKV